MYTAEDIRKMLDDSEDYVEKPKDGGYTAGDISRMLANYKPPEPAKMEQQSGKQAQVNSAPASASA